MHVNRIYILHPPEVQMCGDVIKAYINHIRCPFRPSRKILTDNGTEFKNRLWTDVFDRLKIEQKFTPIYLPQCNGRIEGFHKFLKATIAKQLETHVKWDDLVWKATAVGLLEWFRMKQTKMYVCTLEEFILVEIWIHCCTKLKMN